MASKIEEFLNKILSSRYGKDVRQAIHDGIHQCYEDGKAGSTDLVAREQIANLVSENNPTDGNSELIDIRTSFYGKSYTSAGEAVRSQTKVLTDRLGMEFNRYFAPGKNLINIDNILRNGNGDINTVSGEIKDGSAWVYDFIQLEVGKKYTLSIVNGTARLVFYNFDMSYTDYTTAVDASVSNGYIKTFQAKYPLARLVTYKEAVISETQLEEGTSKTQYELPLIKIRSHIGITDPQILNNLLGKDKIYDYHIMDDSIGISKTSFSKETYNLLNPSRCVQGYMKADGINITDNSSFFTSDFIEIGEIDKIVRTSADMYSICFYDENRSKLQKSADNIQVAEHNVPDNTKYLRITFLTFISNAHNVMVYFGDSKKDFIPFKIIPYEYVEKPESNFPSDVSVVLPEQIVVCNESTICINHQSVLRNFDISKLISFVVAQKKFDTIDYKTFIEGGKNQNGNYSISFQINWGEYINKGFDVINVNKDAGNGLTKKIIFIGDSKTDADKYTQYLLDMFSDDSMNIELLGTRGSGDNKHEGRSGWSAENYVENNAFRGVIEESPFWNPETKQFDFSYYMGHNSYDHVDYVFINLGTNDTYANFIEYYHRLIDGIREYDPNILIAMWIPAPFATFGGYTHIDNDNQTFEMMQAIIDEFDSEENRKNKIYVVPTHMNIDTFYDFPWKDVKINNSTEETYRVCTDQIHESNGYEHVAEVIYGYIKYFATLN